MIIQTIHRYYKFILSLTLVLIPFVWLTFTTDGQRHADLFLLHLRGDPSFNIAYQQLSGTITEQIINEQFPQVQFQCQATATSIGDRVCVASIASFNGIPAQFVRNYFDHGILRMMQLNYRPAYHQVLAAKLHETLGQPHQQSEHHPRMLVWPMFDGLLMFPAYETVTNQDAALIWLAAAAMH
jgi:hypothetical protein